MDKQIIEAIVKEHPYVASQVIKSKYFDFYNDISINGLGDTFSEKLYNWLYNRERKCLKCGRDTKFRSFSEGYAQYCSKKCSNADTSCLRSQKMKVNKETSSYWEEKKCLHCEKPFWSLISRHQRYCSNQCSNFISGKSKGRVLKIRETKLKRYGNPNYVNIQKAKETCRGKYGVENVFELESVQENIRSIRIRKYIEHLKKSDRLKGMVSPLFDVSDYVTGHRDNKYPFKCLKCGSTFTDNVDDGRVPRCQACFPVNSVSVFEKEILAFVEEIIPSEKIETRDRKLLCPLESDIYIPEKKVAIECDGIYWHSEVGGNKPYNYHLRKTQKAEKQGVRLIHVFEDEWIYRKEIVKCRIKNILGIPPKTRIFSRKCKVDFVSKEESNRFFDDNHIQGSVPAFVTLGLYSDNVLVCAMSFGKNRRSLNQSQQFEGEYEMLRFCSLKDVHVVGGCSRLVSRFKTIYHPTKITTFSDLRWGNGEVYRKAGFRFVKTTVPNYWYFKRGDVWRYHRFGFRKNVLEKRLLKFDVSLTEWENMRINGYDRIWDCGNAKYEWIPET